MNVLIKLSALLAMFCTLIARGQSEKIRLRIVNEQNQAVEGVYVGSSNRHDFWYSDSTGVVNIPTSGLLSGDTLSFLHISYKPIQMDVRSIVSSLHAGMVVQLYSDIKLLDEVVVKPLNPTAFVKDAIDLIPRLYQSDPSLAVHADIDIYDANDSTSLIYFKGVLQLLPSNSMKTPMVGKTAETERVAANAKERIYPVRISDFASIISIDKIPVVRLFKEYVFDKYQYVNYRGSEAVQIFFHRNKGKFTQTGSLIINENTKAILALKFSTSPMGNVMKSTIGGSLCYTDLNYHNVEVDYRLNPDGLYEFESGVYCTRYTHRRKNVVSCVVFNFHLKKTISITAFETKKSIDKLFIE